MTKYVILLNFYVFFLQKHKKNKKYKIKKNPAEHLHYGISNYR